MIHCEITEHLMFCFQAQTFCLLAFMDQRGLAKRSTSNIKVVINTT